MKPVGKCCSMNLGSSQLHGLLGPPKTPSWIALFSHFILIVTSGCPPACVSLGVTSKSSIPSHAWAGAVQSRTAANAATSARATRTMGRAVAWRPSVIVLAPIASFTVGSLSNLASAIPPAPVVAGGSLATRLLPLVVPLLLLFLLLLRGGAFGG